MQLRTFVDDYEIIQKEKPELSAKEHFDRVMAKHAVNFEKEITLANEMFKQDVALISLMTGADMTDMDGEWVRKMAESKIDEMDTPLVVQAEKHLAFLAEKMVGYANLPSDFSRIGQVPGITFVTSRIKNKRRSEQKPSKPSTRPTA